MHSIRAWMASRPFVSNQSVGEGLFTTNQSAPAKHWRSCRIAMYIFEHYYSVTNDWGIHSSFPSSLATGVFLDRFTDVPVHSDKAFGPSQRVMILQQMLRNDLTASSGYTSETSTSMVIWLNHQPIFDKAALELLYTYAKRLLTAAHQYQ